MTESTMNRLVRAARSLGVECDPYLEYSGRSMYGRTTCGVTLPGMIDYVRIAATAAVSVVPDGEVDAFLSEIRTTKWDAMGHDVIVY